jgi:RNA polymerase sigma-70 factor, ECF subfamily
MTAVNEWEQFRPALTRYCYRMLGGLFDADDAVQETMIRAWRNHAQFDGRSSLKTWLYRIATNVCLDELKDRGRRARPMEEGDPSTGNTSAETLTKQPHQHWLEPLPDSPALSIADNPDEQASLRQNIRLAFVAALQKLAPKQRAALLMTEVLDCSAAEIAETLNTSVAAVNSALQRARSTLAHQRFEGPAELTAGQQQMLTRYLEAFERYDVPALTNLLSEDATFCMPPFSLWLRGRDQVQVWMLGTGKGCEGSRLLPTSANGSPAFAQYRAVAGDGYRAWALIALELEGNYIAGVTNFLDVDRLFPRFGFPLHLPADFFFSAHR